MNGPLQPPPVVASDLVADLRVPAAAGVGLSVRDAARVTDLVRVLAAAAAAGLAAEVSSTICGRLSVHLYTGVQTATVDAVCAVLAVVGAQVTRIEVSPEGDSTWITAVRDGRQWWAFAATQPRPTDPTG